MQLRTRYPDDAVSGGCFLTGSYSTEEPIVDFDTDLEALPPWGRLCVSAHAVRQMMVVLGWTYDPEMATKVAAQRDVIRTLRAENRALRDAIRSVFDAAELARLEVPEQTLEPEGV